jgi:hypothetical protein
MARKQFVVTYPDRTKANISRSDRDSLLASLLIEPSGFNAYRYIGPQRTFHSFADLSSLKDKLFQPIEQTGYLEGSWIFERDGKRYRESEARVGELVCQLRLRGALA